MDFVDSEKLNEQFKIRLEKLNLLKELGKNPFEVTKFEIDFNSDHIKKNFDSLNGQEVKFAGRIMSKRVMGKISFASLQDFYGTIQCYIKRENMSEENYEEFKKFDIGDIIGVVGEICKTERGEISIKTKTIKLLAKSLNVFPEKFHGLQNTDLKYRQRYVDLIVNFKVKQTFLLRSKIIQEIRSFLSNLGFIEAETPILNNQASGAAARPFFTHHNALDMNLVLRIALELHLKRLIVGGFDKVFEIGRVFRNEGIDTKHNPEFTLLELYEAYTDFEGMMELTENLIKNLAQKVLNKKIFKFSNFEIDLSKPFEKVSMLDSIKKSCGVDFFEVKSLDEAQNLAKLHKIELEKHHKIGDIIGLFFEKYVEKNLIQPTFVTHYPVDISPLAKQCVNNSNLTERFELFIAGREMANAFSELNDPVVQRLRFEEQAKLKELGNEEACDVDEDFLNALAYGMPPTGGLGIGIDRLVMLLTENDSIRDVILFPTLKNVDK